MFEAIESGHKLSKEKFDAGLPKLRADLLSAHFELKEQKFPVIIIVAGSSGSGKGELVQRLNEWLDPHGVDTHAFWETSKEKHERPEYWRYWRAMPGRGRVGIFFGSWYSEPILGRVCGKIKSKKFDAQLDRIAAFEKMLTDDGTVLVKLWLHLSKKAQRKSLDKLGNEATDDDWKYLKLHDKVIQVAEHAISHTDSGSAPWHLIDASDRRNREFTAGTLILNAVKQKLAAVKEKPTIKVTETQSAKPALPTTESILDRVDLAQTLSVKEYQRALEIHQAKLGKLTWAAHEKQRSTVLVFEGWDAAGKGSAIRRVIHAMDPRLYRVVGIAAPTDEERAQHYLWRFWRRLPQPGYATLFDRSWYGRLLVERVEGFASPTEWGRSFSEINQFEEQLTDHGMVLNKFWIHISPEEELRRFKERQRVSYKQYKITDEDWRNRKKWDDYKVAVNDMVARCGTANAPWTLVAGNDKKFARIQILKTIIDRIEEAL